MRSSSTRIVLGCLWVALLSGFLVSGQGAFVPPTDGFFVAANGSDSNAGTFAAPFLTFTKAQSAMEASGGSKLKTYVRAGTYSFTSTLTLTSSDNGEIWQYYPGDGYDTATISLAGLTFSDPGTPSGSVTTGILIQGGNNITINGFTVSGGGFLGSGITVHGGAEYYGTEYAATGTAHGNTVENCIVFDLGESAFDTSPFLFYSGISAAGDVQNSQFINNVVHDVGGTAFQVDVGSQGPNDGGNNFLIANNVAYNLNQTSGTGDSGGIYVIDRTLTVTGWAIKNNFIRDYGPTENEFHAIYIDDEASNVTVSGNIVAANLGGAGNNANPGLIHIGGNNTISGNIIDLNFAQPILWYQTSATGNSFTGNIIIGGFTGSGGGYLQVTPPTGANLAVSNNLYFNYAGGTISDSGSSVTGGADSSPITGTNPQISGWTYTIASGSPVFGSPLNFPPIVGGWGPPGFTIPQTGTAPSSPH